MKQVVLSIYYAAHNAYVFIRPPASRRWVVFVYSGGLHTGGGMHEYAQVSSAHPHNYKHQVYVPE